MSIVSDDELLAMERRDRAWGGGSGRLANGSQAARDRRKLLQEVRLLRATLELTRAVVKRRGKDAG